MAFLSIRNVELKGVAACVPANVEENIALSNIPDVEKLIKTTGVERKRKVTPGICTSDLCFEAAEKLISELNWNKADIQALIFVTQTPDFIVPATSCILQDRLALPVDCLTLDISLGCSGFVYGLSTLASYMQNGMITKALLLAGDTSSMTCSVNDKSTYPLFGDAGTATALEYVEGSEGFKFHLGSDGRGFKDIIINDGGYRNQVNADSLYETTVSEGISRNSLQLSLDGMNVFSFGISKAPESVNLLIEKFSIDKAAVNFAFFHQANKMMNDRIRKKLQFEEEQVPSSLKDFGNTSSASIPLTMVTQTAAQLQTGEQHIIACGFGVGLSWASMYCKTKLLVIPQLLIHD
ncbi:ketoacyl-ACP synthase III [Mucilaginibacter pallidiroseus]|uniref:Ketoacyl-ACP synthase III n=1 Tax=Mucilaginibacter pallidiroseus TaxID=2599295 RepID=A0A563U0L9_9SPHI|nr:ketoacyl-ACP synthase III [Mucilaginibacter pallidiroseus]TWR25174.1 ketoacyl-ACP synthase III [Mucilaginibacter pallidiroseus]